MSCEPFPHCTVPNLFGIAASEATAGFLDCLQTELLRLNFLPKSNDLYAQRAAAGTFPIVWTLYRALQVLDYYLPQFSHALPPLFLDCYDCHHALCALRSLQVHVPPDE